MKRTLLILMLTAIIFAELPATLSYQGKITDAVGSGLNATYPVTFKIYDAETGGTELWSESHGSVLVNKGLFSVILGNVSPLDLGFDEQYWLEIIIDGDIMIPRQPLTAGAYAFRAIIADSLAGGIPEVTGDTMVAHWDSLRDVPTSIMFEGEDISLMNNDANYIDTVITDSTLTGNGAISPLSLAQRGATDGQVLKWSESSWRPMDEAGLTEDQVILNQHDSSQVADFDIEGTGKMEKFVLRPNPYITQAELVPGFMKTILTSDGFKALVYDGECWIEMTSSDDCFCCPCIDYDGNEYETILIGSQCWMKENLKTTHYRDGTPIGHVTDATEWGGLSTGAYCAYDNDPSNIETYGLLYNWYAVEDAHGLCPTGWHVPTDEEWKTLEMYLGMSETEADGTGYRGTNEGSRLAGRTDIWSDGSLESDPEFGISGFTALPGGSRNRSGLYSNMTRYAYFWSSSEFGSTNAWYRALYYYNTDIDRYYDGMRGGYSVRCLKGSGPLLMEIEEQASDTFCITIACTLALDMSGGVEPYEYDWNMDGTGDWDDNDTLIFTITEECDTIICQIRDDEMSIAVDTIIINGKECTCGIVTDYDGNSYETIQIGTQCWMKENLKTTHYRDGTPIQHVTDDTEWEGLDSPETGAYCNYDNDPSNVTTYGRLYNCYAVDDAHGLCPDGWHVPTDEEWQTLIDYLGSSPGSKLAGRADLWPDGALESAPEFSTSGFSALPGGYRHYDGAYHSMASSAFFWSSTEYGSFFAYYRYLLYLATDVARDRNYKRYGRSVRCVRD